MSDEELIVRTDLAFDGDRLLDVFEETADLPREHHALAVTTRAHPDDDVEDVEMDHTLISDPFRDTYIEEILESLPFRYGRTRLMTVPPQRCYPVHFDRSIRYHIAVETHASAFILFPEAGKLYNIPEDGFVYRMDARQPHTAINCGPFVRTHLVIVGEDYHQAGR